jgi:transglutaminase-like putative cysteine protease
VELADYARESFGKDTPLLAGRADLTRRIFEDFKFDPKATTVATPLEEVWKNGAASARISRISASRACARSGLPARYVSGYLRTHPPEGKPRSSARTRATRGSGFFVPAPAGWILIRRTTSSRARNTSSSPTAAISATSARWREFSPAAANMMVKVSVDVEPLN